MSLYSILPFFLFDNELFVVRDTFSLLRKTVNEKRENRMLLAKTTEGGR